MPEPQDNIPPTLPLPPSRDDGPDTIGSTPAPRPPEPASTQADQPSRTGVDSPATENLEPPRSDAPRPVHDPTAMLPPPGDDSPTQVGRTLPLSAAVPGTIALPPSFAETGTPAAAQGSVPGYEILSELGRGGMGVVYKARQIGLKRIVALKMILSGAHAGKQELERFRAEAEAVAQLQHPNIVQIYEVGTAEGRPYFSLEFLEGGSLADRLKGEPMSPRLAAQLVEVLSRAMHTAHQAGIVHRDLKPANVLLGRQPTRDEVAAGAFALGSPKITDFGLAKKLDSEGSRTQSGSVLGTPNYMAPEQAAGKISEIGPAADVYALGAILYELLTGRPPFRGDSPWDTVKQVINDDPLPPTRLRRGLPRDLETICLKCLHKEPSRRYPTAAALAEDLQRWLAGEPIQARPVSDWEKMVKWAKRQPAVAALVAMLVLVIGGGLVGMAILWRLAERQKIVAQQNAADAIEAREEAEEQAELARLRGEEAHEAYRSQRREAYASKLNLAQTALQEARFDRARSLLAELGHREKNEEDLRGFEWYYLERLSHSGLALRGHTNLVSQLVFSPDGKRMVTSSLDGTVKVWDPVKGNTLLSLDGHKKPVRAVAYSPDGKRIATASEDGTARVWDAENGKQLFELHGHRGFVTGVAFSSDGRRLATAGDDHVALLWDLSSDFRPEKVKPTHELRGHEYGLTSIAFRPDGRQVATASWDRTVRLWDADTGHPEGILRGHDHWVRCVAYSPDGKKLATAGWDRKVRVWDPLSRELLRTLTMPDAPAQSVCFSPEGQRLLTLGIDQTARLWDLNSPDEPPQRIGSGPIRGIAFSPDGQLLASVRFDFTGRSQEVDATFSGHTSSVLAVAFRPAVNTDEFASGGADGAVKIWDARKEELLRTLTGHDGPIRALAYSPDGKLLATGGEDGTVRLWDASSGQSLRTFQSHRGWVTCVAFSPDGKRLASGSEDRGVRVWNVADRGADSALVTVEEADSVKALAYSRDGKRLAIGTADGTLHFRDAVSGDDISKLTAHQGQVGALAYSPDGKRLATAGWDGVVVLRDADTGKSLRELKGHAYGVTALAFSPDGKRLASASEDRTVKVWDLSSGRDLLTLTPHAAGVTGVAFSHDGDMLLSSCWDQNIRLWRGPRK